MATLRTPGVFNFSSNFEALIAAPLDARLTVATYAALTDGATIPYPYLGMVVVVTSDTGATTNGMYYCTDIGTTPAFASATTVWAQVGSTSSDTYTTGGTVSGTTIELHLNNGAPDVSIDISSIISGANTYVTGGTTSADTGGTTNIDLDLTLNDSTTVNIDLSNALTFINAEPVKKTVGGITLGETIFSHGKTMQEIIQAIFYPAIAPTISYSSASLSEGSPFTAAYIEIGFIDDLPLNAVFTKGQSVVAGQSTRYMGSPNQYTYSGDSISGTEIHLVTGTTDSFTILGYTVIQGTNVWHLSVNYDSAPVTPVYDDGSTYVDTAFTNSGSKVANASFEGVYPIYAATATTTVLTKQSLVSMASANNLQYTIVAEANPGEHTFAIADDWLTGRPLTAVQYYNTVSSTFDPANKITDWVTTSTTKTIQGNTVNYTKYTKDVALPAAAARTIKLIF
jgi:hypothetical protein